MWPSYIKNPEIREKVNNLLKAKYADFVPPKINMNSTGVNVKAGGRGILESPIKGKTEYATPLNPFACNVDSCSPS